MKAFINFILGLFKKKKVEAPIRVPPPIVINTETKKNNLENWDGLFADISHWEKNFDAKKYGRPILINKCTDGIKYIDPTHKNRKLECEANKIIYGGYHFFQCGVDPIKQAEHYIKTHGEFVLSPIVDFEKDNNQDESALKKELPNLLRMLKAIETITSKKPVIYTYIGLIHSIGFGKEFGEYPLWIARYNLALGPIPSPWTNSSIVAWQYGDGKLKAPYQNNYAGIGPCDGNIYFKNNDHFGLLKSL